MEVTKLVSILVYILVFYGNQIKAEDFLEELNKKEDIDLLWKAELQTDSVISLKLNQNFILFDENGDGKKEKLPVVLISTSYKGSKIRLRKNKTFDEYGLNFGFYELRSISELGIFSYAICSSTCLGYFRLFCNSDGKSYMSWIEGREIQFIEVSKIIDRVEAVTNFFADEDKKTISISVEELFGREPFRGPYATFRDIFVESIALGKDGLFTVTFTGHDKNILYTVTQTKDGKWIDATKKKEE